jgi:hypothetical protein
MEIQMIIRPVYFLQREQPKQINEILISRTQFLKALTLLPNMVLVKGDN